jgi:hypothetical protein
MPPSGVSLLEVLVSMFVLSVGLIGMAALLPVGRFAILETGKADRAGACGRAALHQVKVCRMLDNSYWSSPGLSGSGGSFAVDPLGALKLTGAAQSSFGGANGIPRITLLTAPAAVGGAPLPFATADQFFTWQDDLTFGKPEDMSPPPTSGRRPVGLINQTGQLAIDGNYSWFFTVTPSPVEAANAAFLNPTERHYMVSIVVCYRRDFTMNGSAPNGEKTATVNLVGGGLSGGDVVLSNFSAPWNVRENDWIALCGGNPASGIPLICRWYRVVSVGDDNLHFSLNGPDCLDWAGAGANVTVTAVTIEKSVVGVYTKTVEVDKDALW